MDSGMFLIEVEARAGCSAEEARLATEATLNVLADQLSAAQAAGLAERVPVAIRPSMDGDAEPERIALQEFIQRIAARLETDVPSAARRIVAVFTVLGEVLDEEEITGMAAALPLDFGPLIAAAQPHRGRIVTAGEFVIAVAERAGLEVEAAALATAAVLETLGERITHGEVEDLKAELPPELHPPLDAGDKLSHGAARRMPLREFVDRVAEREAAIPEQALVDARAVFGTLRQAVTEKEFSDVTAQLPREYAPLLARP
jgi:uncharacterized protein (DUF2267 family)